MRAAARWLRAHASILIVLAVVVGLAGANLEYTVRQGHDFCDLIAIATRNPVPKPADPAANPSREQNYQGYIGAVQLGRRLGCRR